MKLNEVMDRDIADAAVNDIMRDCQPFLADATELFYRGLETLHMSTVRDVMKLPVDKNRKSKDSSLATTEALNDVYEWVGSPVRRTNCIFASTTPSMAASYGDVYVVFPIGEYHALWNNQIDDAYSKFEEDSTSAGKYSSFTFDQEIDYTREATSEYNYQLLQNFIENLDYTPEEEKEISGLNWSEVTKYDNKKVGKQLSQYETTPKYKKELKLFIQEYLSDSLNDGEGYIDPEKIYDQFGDTFNTDISREPVDHKIEVMFTCDSYYAIERRFFEEYVDNRLLGALNK